MGRRVSSSDASVGVRVFSNSEGVFCVGETVGIAPSNCPVGAADGEAVGKNHCITGERDGAQVACPSSRGSSSSSSSFRSWSFCVDSLFCFPHGVAFLTWSTIPNRLRELSSPSLVAPSAISWLAWTATQYRTRGSASRMVRIAECFKVSSSSTTV